MGGIIIYMTEIINKTCLMCTTNLVKSTKMFCSRTCRGKHQSIHFTGKNSSNYKGGNPNCIDCSIQLPHRYPQRGFKTRCQSCKVIFQKGVNHPRWTGKYVTINGKTKTICNVCCKPTGDRLSLRCQQCTRGRIHHAYKHGLSPVQSLIRSLPENRTWIKNCMRRDNFTCFGCGYIPTKANSLQVHHIKQYALILKQNSIDTIDKAKNCSELWDINNGITLCKACHKLTDSFNKKLKQ